VLTAANTATRDNRLLICQFNRDTLKTGMPLLVSDEPLDAAYAVNDAPVTKRDR